jgi:uncharacterized SAM-binding protein YcdF (DUF218 family)
VAAFDAIVVLGAPPSAEGEATPTIRRRVRAGVDAWQEGAAPVLLLAGGPTTHDRAEADIMAELACEAGVPEAALILERRSTRTLENAREVRHIAEWRGWRRLLLVTDAPHLPRALYTFRRFGLQAEGRAAPGLVAEAGIGRALALALREAVAFICYFATLRREDTTP